MKTKILSIFLVAVMLVSMLAAYPMTVNAAEGDTFNASDANPKISTYSDLKAFKSAVDGGKDFSGVTVKLVNDIELDDTWSAIGPNSGGTSRYFCGTFDGQGHTITFNDASDNGQGQYGVFRRLNNATIKDLKLDGNIVVGQENAYAGALAMEANGNCTIKNVYSSVDFSTGKNAYYVGGLVSYIKNGSGHTLTLDGCIYDGKMNFTNFTKYTGGLLGYFEHSGSSVVVKNSVYAGTIMLNDKDYSYRVGGFTGWGTNITMTDCISIGKITFDAKKSWTESADDDIRGVLIGEVTGAATLANVYYLNIGAPNGYTSSVLDAIDKSTNTPNLTNVVAKTSAEMATLTASDFSATANLSYKDNAVNLYYPCPAGLAPATGWLSALTVAYDSARVAGAQIRCADPADQYSGIRFVTYFDASKVEGAGTADANFGVILVSKEKYDTLDDKTSVAALEAVGVKVAATNATTADGVVTVKAVVYNIQVENYKSDLVAVAYIGDTVIDSATRSIYQVATLCVADAAATEFAKTFAQNVITTADSAN